MKPVVHLIPLTPLPSVTVTDDEAELLAEITAACLRSTSIPRRHGCLLRATARFHASSP